MTLVEELQQFCERLVEQGGFILLPVNASAVGQTNFPLERLTRVDDIVVQKNGNDGGDSAHRTGILAFCGNVFDQKLLPPFEHDGLMVRHPTQTPWNNPDNCSRDQLLAFAAGCWRAGRNDIAGRLLKQTEDRNNTAQNIDADAKGTRKVPPIGDPILPHEHMFLRVCAGQEHAHWDLAGQWLLQATIESIKTLPQDTEINQLIVECIVCCRLDHFVKHVPDYEARIHRYWNDPGTQQSQIGDALIAVIHKELERYRGFISLAFPPLPVESMMNIIDKVGTALEEIREGKLPHFMDPTQVAKTLADFKDTLEAAMADAKNTLEYYISFGPKLFDIAAKLQSLFPSSLPNPLGLLGSTQQSDMAEIKRALEEINRKLDDILHFLKTDLGPVVRESVNAAMSNILAIEAGERIQVKVQPLIKTISIQKDKGARRDNLSLLRTETGEAIVKACTAVRLSPVAVMPIVEAFVGVMSAGSTLLRYDPTNYSIEVEGWCENIIKALEEGLGDINAANPAPMSLADISRQLPTYEEALAAAALIKPEESQIAIYWGLQRRKSEPRGRRDDNIKPEPFWTVFAYGALLYAFDIDRGEWQISDGLRSTGHYAGEPPADFPYLPTPGESYFAKPWWPLTVDFGGPWEDRGRDMKARANILTSQSRKLSARIEVNSQIEIVRNVIAQAKKLQQTLIEAEKLRGRHAKPMWAVNYTAPVTPLLATMETSAKVPSGPQRQRARKTPV